MQKLYQCFIKINNIDNPTARINQGEKESIQITNIKNETVLTTDSTYSKDNRNIMSSFMPTDSESHVDKFLKKYKIQN